MSSLSAPLPRPGEPFDFETYQSQLRAQERQYAASVLAPLGVLPPRPHIEHYKRVARERLTLRRKAEPDVKLSLVQDELARENGLPNWPTFSQAVSDRNVRAREFLAALRRKDEAAVLSALESDAGPVVDVALSASEHDLSYLAGVAHSRSKAAASTLCLLGFAFAQSGAPETLAGQLHALQLQYFDFDWWSASTVIGDRRAAAEEDPTREHEVEGFDEALSVLATHEEFDSSDGPFDMDY